MLEVNTQRFEELTKAALDELPEQFLQLMDNLFVEVEEKPSPDDLASVGMKPEESLELLGLYQGIPLEARGAEYSGLPDRVVLYRQAILSICETEADVQAEIRDTLVHEIGHYFGLSDEDMPY